MEPLVTDWIQAITAIVTGVFGLAGAIFAIVQVYQIKNQLSSATLTNVLTLEAEMNSRKAKLDDINNEIEKANLEGKLDKNAKEVFKRYQNSAIENWLNSVDRLCFCIKSNYLKEKDWKMEYRDYIIDIVRTYEDKFGESSLYTNIKDINQKWLRE
ncbi:MAG: hypothetical protein SPI86_09710 [Treponemataceae bacterium]|nr:hypothetical protein [Treponemataceae bacterium]